MSENKKSSGESFAGNVMKYSVATYLGFAITGLALIVKGLLPAEVLGAPVTFMTYAATIMNIGILGLDQALLRFYHEPPAVWRAMPPSCAPGSGANTAARYLYPNAIATTPKLRIAATARTKTLDVKKPGSR